MKAVNVSRYALLGERVIEARTLLARTRGLLGTVTLPRGEALWLHPCRGIHSFGMRYEYDPVFPDRAGRVVGACRRFRRNRISRIFWRARGVLELPAGTIDRTATQLGDVPAGCGWAPSRCASFIRCGSRPGNSRMAINSRYRQSC